MNCYQAKAGELAKQWYVIDATDMVVGRLAAQIAPILMGKHRPTYTPHIDTGDYVIVTNVDKVVFTGNKWQQKSLPAVHRPPRRPEGREGLEAVPAPARADLATGRPADDAEEQDRPAHAVEDEALRRRRSTRTRRRPDPARGALGPPDARRRGIPSTPEPKAKAEPGASPQSPRPRHRRHPSSRGDAPPSRRRPPPNAPAAVRRFDRATETTRRAADTTRVNGRPAPRSDAIPS